MQSCPFADVMVVTIFFSKLSSQRMTWRLVLRSQGGQHYAQSNVRRLILKMSSESYRASLHINLHCIQTWYLFFNNISYGLQWTLITISTTATEPLITYAEKVFRWKVIILRLKQDETVFKYSKIGQNNMNQFERAWNSLVHIISPNFILFKNFFVAITDKSIVFTKVHLYCYHDFMMFQNWQAYENCCNFKNLAICYIKKLVT